MNKNDLNEESEYNGKQDLNHRLAIAWIGLTFYGRSLIICKKGKVILNEINGNIDFGTLNALMGPSGSGKSTLLKCINGQNISSLDKNTQIFLSKERKLRTCFIVQDISEHLLMGLTAIQSLIYASKLKNRSTDMKVNHRNIARKLLSDLMISDIEKTVVENCSGGEQKRLAIALELTAIKKPNILCIDEPTSGLDSNAAEIVIQCLKIVSRKHNMAVVTSIHQPNNDVLMLFDKLYVLSKAGYCIYEGPPQELRHHLNVSQFDCNEHQVPIEVLLKIASNRDDNVQRLVTQSQTTKSNLRQRCLVEGVWAPDGITHKIHKFDFKQMWYLFQRTVTYSFRSQWKAMILQFVFIVGLGFISTKLYNKHSGEPDGCFTFNMTSNNSCIKTEDTLREEQLLSQNLRLQFFAGIMIQFLLTVATTLIFATEVKIFLNEHKNGWYSTGSYYLSKSIVELPLCLLITICYTFIIYKSNNQIEDNQRMIAYLVVIIVGALCSQGLGFMIGIIASSNDKLILVLSVGLYLLQVMLCGFFAPIEELPKGIQWISHTSYVKQTFEMQLTLIYGFDRCPTGMLSSILYQNNIRDEENFWRNCIILTFHTINYRVLALIILLVKSNSINLRLTKRAVPNNELTIETFGQISYM